MKRSTWQRNSPRKRLITLADFFPTHFNLATFRSFSSCLTPSTKHSPFGTIKTSTIFKVRSLDVQGFEQRILRIFCFLISIHLPTTERFSLYGSYYFETDNVVRIRDLAGVADPGNYQLTLVMAVNISAFNNGTTNGTGLQQPEWISVFVHTFFEFQRWCFCSVPSFSVSMCIHKTDAIPPRHCLHHHSKRPLHRIAR